MVVYIRIESRDRDRVVKKEKKKNVPAEFFRVLNRVIDGVAAQCAVGIAAMLPHVTLVLDGAAFVARLDVPHARSVNQIF